MMKKITLLTSMISSALILSACGENGISESELKKAINETATYQEICMTYHLKVESRLSDENVANSTFGAENIRLLKRTADGTRTNEEAIKQMDNLVKAGLYKRGKEERVGEKNQEVRYENYHLTERGHEFISTSHQKPILCIGTQYADSINYFTEPTPNQGMTVIKVSYQAKVRPEKWARSLLDKETSNRVFDGENERNITLVKTNQGWRDIHSIK